MIKYIPRWSPAEDSWVPFKADLSKPKVENKFIDYENIFDDREECLVFCKTKGKLIYDN